MEKYRQPSESKLLICSYLCGKDINSFSVVFFCFPHFRCDLVTRNLIE